MILQALCSYYKNKPELSRYGWESEEFRAFIILNPDGTFNSFSILKDADILTVPERIRGTSDNNANIFWDNKENILFEKRDNFITEKEQKQYKGIETKHKNFVEKISYFHRKTQHPNLKAVLTFLENIPIEDLKQNQNWNKIKNNEWLTFKIREDIFFENENIINAYEEWKTEQDALTDKNKLINCLITGEKNVPLENTHKGIIANAKLISFDKDSYAFNSFNKSQGGNAPVSKKASFQYSTALKHLLASDSNSCSFYKNKESEIKYVFWREFTQESNIINVRTCPTLII